MNTIAAMPAELAGPFDETTPGPAGLQLVRASGLAQARLQLAILSGNRRRALCEIDRLVEIDRKLAGIVEGSRAGGSEISGEAMELHLARQRQAIATEKLALGAAVEFPRVAPAEHGADELLLGEEQEIVVVDDADFARRLSQFAFWLIGLIVAGTLLAVAVPILAAG